MVKKDGFIVILFFVIISLIWHSFEVTVSGGLAAGVIYFIILEKFTGKKKM